MLLVNTFMSLLKTLLNCANIKNSRGVFKTQLKRRSKIVLHKYKKLVFQISGRNFLFGKLFFPSNYKKFFSFGKFVFFRQL